MQLGIDFDNTIVRYDRVFHKQAVEQYGIPPEIPANKRSVRDELRRRGREEEWTLLQGQIYGPSMVDAEPFPGVLECLSHVIRDGVQVFIISHRSRTPYKGPQHDLHRAAWKWLERQGFFDPSPIGIPRDHVFFEVSRQEKAARIAAAGCTHFIDDLPEFLTEPTFPKNVTQLLFDPNNAYRADLSFPKLTSWLETEEYIQTEKNENYGI